MVGVHLGPQLVKRSVCNVLAISLITKVIDPIVSGIIFAIALVVFGGVSRGFRKTT